MGSISDSRPPLDWRTTLARLARALRFTWGAVLAMACCVDPSGGLVPPTVDQDPDLPARELNGTRVHLQTRGDPEDPVVILLHGGPGGDHRALLRFVEPRYGRSLADDYFVVLWDQRGSGLSRRHSSTTELGLDDFLADLEALIDEVAPPPRPVFLVGHSWGGTYAAMYMNAHPDRLAGAVLLEPGELTPSLRDADLDFDPTLEWLNDMMWAQRVISLDDHARADFYMQLGRLSDDAQGQRDDEPSPAWRSGAAVMAYTYLEELDGPVDFTTNLHQVETEVLFIAGGAAGDLNDAFQARQVGFFREARLEVVPDAGHSDLVWAHAETSLRLVLAYLDARVSR